jgi:hypothetical protein
MPKSDLRYVSKWGLPGPNSEFLEDRCTNRLEPYTVGKGLKSSTRQRYKVVWDMTSWGPSRTE